MKLDTYEYQRWRRESLNARCKTCIASIFTIILGCVAIENVTQVLVDACVPINCGYPGMEEEVWGWKCASLLQTRATPGLARASQPGKRAPKHRSYQSEYCVDFVFELSAVVLQTIWLSCGVGILLNLSEASRWNPSHKPRLYKQSQSEDWSDVKPRSNCRHEDSIKEALKCDNTFSVSHQEKLGIFSQHLSFNKVPMFPFRRHQTHIRASPTWIKRSIKVF